MINFEPLNMEATKKIALANYYFNTGKCFFFLFVICTFVGCNKKEQRPPDVLEKQKLASIMVELYLTEARLSSYPIQRDSSLRLFLPREKAILTKANVPDSILRKTYDYYLQHPDDFNDVYDIVIDSLTVMEKIKPAENPIK